MVVPGRGSRSWPMVTVIARAVVAKWLVIPVVIAVHYGYNRDYGNASIASGLAVLSTPSLSFPSPSRFCASNNVEICWIGGRGIQENGRVGIRVQVAKETECYFCRD
jgi:hypothetical protein